MSKRIVEYGENSIITCGECGCKFVFEKSDIKEDDTVTCPFCNAVNSAEGKIPMGGK